MKKLFTLFLSIVLLLGISVAGAGGRVANAAGASVDPALEEKLSSQNLELVATAIVTYDHQPTVEEITTLKLLGLKTLPFKQLPMVAVQGPLLALGEVVALPGVVSVYEDKPLNYLLNESAPYIGADKVWNDLGYTGKGHAVAVIDSGIDASHPDLAFGEKTVQNVKFLVGNLIFEGQSIYVENVVTSETTTGHGTHVAGTIGGTGAASEGRYTGVAPGVDLVGLGVGDGLSILWALEAFDWVLENQTKYNIKVISNSWGTTGEYEADDPINVASKLAHDRGITVVFAAGNEGPDENTLNPYSVAPWVIGVAAGTKDGKLADFSSRGVPGDALLHPTLTAPGVNIVAARAKTGTVMNGLDAADDATYIPSQYVTNYTTASGTSMATPHISGVVSLMLEANPTLTPDRIKEILIRTATPMPEYQLHEAGAGNVNAYEAVVAAKQNRKK